MALVPLPRSNVRHVPTAAHARAINSGAPVGSLARASLRSPFTPDVNVIQVSADTDGVQIRRVRLRANAFHCQNSQLPTGSRVPQWSARAGDNCDWGKSCPNPWPYHVQPAIMLLGRNYEISGCDLWATWNVLYSGLTPPPPSPPPPPGTPPPDPHASRGPWKNSEFGLITNNELWNGDNCHW